MKTFNYAQLIQIEFYLRLLEYKCKPKYVSLIVIRYVLYRLVSSVNDIDIVSYCMDLSNLAK